MCHDRSLTPAISLTNVLAVVTLADGKLLERWAYDDGDSTVMLTDDIESSLGVNLNLTAKETFENQHRIKYVDSDAGHDVLKLVVSATTSTE